MKITTESRNAYIAVVVQMVLIGFSFMALKIALDYSTPFDILGHRFIFAFVASSIPVLFGLVKLRMTPLGAKMLIPLGIFYPSLFFAFQLLGIQYTTTSEAGIIFASTPILVALLAAVVLKEKTTILQRIFIVVSVSGVIYIVLMRGSDVPANYSFKGIFYTLLSAGSTAIYTVLVRKYRHEYSNYTLMYMMMLIGLVVFNGISLAQHTLNGTWSEYLYPLWEMRYLSSVFYVGVISTFITQYLAIYAVARVEASKIGVFNNLSTIVIIFAGVVFLGEKLHLYHIIGTITILAGIIGSNYFARREA